MGRTACTEPQCLYKGAVHLLPYVSYYTLLLEPVLFFFNYSFHPPVLYFSLILAFPRPPPLTLCIFYIL